MPEWAQFVAVLLIVLQFCSQITQLTENIDGGTGRVTSYGYDVNGNITVKGLPNGDQEVAAFDVLNRVSQQNGTSSGGGSLYSYDYGYDLKGNLTVEDESYPSGLDDREVGNSYDAVDRLIGEGVVQWNGGGVSPQVIHGVVPLAIHGGGGSPPPSNYPNYTAAYTYDAANNRTSKTITGYGADTLTYTYNNLNQLTGYTDGTRSVVLTYDLNGNRATRVVSGGSDNGTDTYSYDFENRLIGLVKGTAGGAGTYAYGYDYRTRRITRDESSAGGVVTHVIFSGGTSVQELDGSNTTPTVEYVRGSDYGGGVGGILYTTRSGTFSYTHENKRGDVIAKTDGSGTLTYQAQYESFGQQMATNGSTLDRQKSNSKDTDPTGLVDEGFRYRDLETGMFISKDPAGFVDGPNLYSYVRCNPWTSFDPEGLWTGEEILRDEGDVEGEEVLEGSELLALGSARIYGPAPAPAAPKAAAPAAAPAPAAATPPPATTAASTAGGTTPVVKPGANTGGNSGTGITSSTDTKNASPTPTAEATQAQSSKTATPTSPNAAMRANANATGSYVDPLTGNQTPATGTLAADHVVPQNDIKVMPGFDQLSSAQQSWLLNHPLNTQGLPTTFNSSKGAKPPGQWEYKGQALDPGYAQNEADKGKMFKDMAQQHVNDQNTANGK